MQDHKVISPVLQPCQEMCICVDQLGEDCLFGKKLLQRGHQFHDRERGTGADTDRAQSLVVCQHTELAAKYGKYNTQIILRWHVQSGNVVFPMILYTFFDKYDFSGKTIIPFNSHMGSGDGGTYDTIRKLEPGARVLTGLPVEMRDAENGPAKAVEQWLRSLKAKGE